MAEFLPGLLATTSDFAVVVDNAKSHSDLYKNVYRRQRLSLLSADLERLDTSGRFNAICECFQEIHPKPPPPKHPRFNRWEPEPEKAAVNASLNVTTAAAATLSSTDLEDLQSLRPPSLMNASMPQRQESEDPDTIRAILASINDTSMPPSDSSSEGGCEGGNRTLLAGSSPLLPLLAPPSLVNASFPKRQDSKDPETIEAMIRSLKDIEN